MPVGKCGGEPSGAQLSRAGLVHKIGDTMLGVLSMGGFRLTNEGEPLEASDGATRAFAELLDKDNLPLAGGTMAGPLDMSGHKIVGLGVPAAARDAATKEYVDSQATGEPGWLLKLEIRGRTMSRVISKLVSLENFGALVVTYLPAGTVRIVSVRPGVYGLTASEPTTLAAEVSVATDADLLAAPPGVFYLQVRLNHP